MTKRRRETTKIALGTKTNPILQRVYVIHAKTKVTINGTLADALLGTPGETVGCHLSECCMNKNNKSVWVEHPPPILAAFTRSTAYMLIQLYKQKRAGIDGVAVKYRHNYSDIVDLNDTDPAKTIVRRNPKLAERSFTLYPPNPRKLDQPKNRPSGKTFTGRRRALVPAGALRRAETAGLLNPGVVKLLKREED